jgi:hypothetical protein
MEPTDRAEIISACRQYADSKFKLRRLFPSLKTPEEIDQIATVLIDVASNALSNALDGEAKKIKHSLGRVEKASAKAPIETPIKEPELLRDRIKAVLKANDNLSPPSAFTTPMTAKQIAEAIEARGWKTGSGTYPFPKLVLNTILKNKTLFIRRGQGLYALHKGTTKAPTPKTQGKGKRSSLKGSVDPLRVFEVIDRDFKDQPFTAKAIAEKLGVHPWSIRGTFRRLREEGFIVPKGKLGMKERPWALSPQTKKLNGKGMQAVSVVFS